MLGAKLGWAYTAAGVGEKERSGAKRVNAGGASSASVSWAMEVGEWSDEKTGLVKDAGAPFGTSRRGDCGKGAKMGTGGAGGVWAGVAVTFSAGAAMDGAGASGGIAPA